MSIVKLQTKNLPLADSLTVIQEVKSKFQSLKGTQGKAVLLKLQKDFEKNEGKNAGENTKHFKRRR